MALIRHFQRKDRERYSAHEEIEASYFSFQTDGRRLLQIDSYGSADREQPGKQSQTIQLDRDGAHELYRIIKDTFRFD